MAVEGFVGHQGDGKTYCLVANLVEAALRGNAVYSNLAIVGCNHFDTWDELMFILERAKDRDERVVVGVDEAGKFLSSRFWQRADPRMLTFVQERRKIARGVDIYFTVPSWRMIDSHLRDVTQRVRVCKRFGGTEYSHDTGRPPVLFREAWMWPEHMTTEHMGARKRAKPHHRRWLWFCRELAELYETGVLDMDKPMAEHLNTRADFYGPTDLARRPA